MFQRLVIAALLLLLAFSGLAQTSPCSGGTTNPLFTVIVGNPVQLKFEHLTVHTLTPPQAAIAGNNIIVGQYATDVPPPPAAALALNCNSQTVSLGPLAPGMYSVTWDYLVPSGVPDGHPWPIETHTFSFSFGNVPALSGPALACLMLLLGAFGVVMSRR